MYRKARSPEIEARERMRDLNVREDAGRYLRARLILNDLREKHLAGKIKITYDECKALRARAIAGDVDGAVKGLAMLLRRRELEGMGL